MSSDSRMGADRSAHPHPCYVSALIVGRDRGLWLLELFGLVGHPLATTHLVRGDDLRGGVAELVEGHRTGCAIERHLADRLHGGLASRLGVCRVREGGLQ